MAIAVIRYSISGEKSNKTGNAVREVLSNAGFHRVGTAGYSASGDPADLSVALRQALQAIEQTTGGGTLDSLWINLYDTSVNDTRDFSENVD